jgi:tetratricopeptide (TPR) repeat protein
VEEGFDPTAEREMSMRRAIWRTAAVLALVTLTGVVSADYVLDFQAHLGDLRGQGLYANGVTECATFVVAHPTVPWGFVERARCQMEVGEYHLAAADLRVGISLSAGYVAYELLGECYQDLGYDDESVVYFNRCEALVSAQLALTPQDPDAWFWRGRCSYGLGHPDLCITYSQRACVYRPAFFEAGLFLANVLFAVQGEPAADVWYVRCMAWNPRAVVAYTQEARCCVEVGDWNGWDRDLDRCCQINPHYAPAAFVRGFGEERQGHLAEAQAQYARATDLDPKYAAAWAKRAEVAGRLRHHDEAQQYTEKAVAIEKEQPHAAGPATHIETIQPGSVQTTSGTGVGPPTPKPHPYPRPLSSSEHFLPGNHGGNGHHDNDGGAPGIIGGTHDGDGGTKGANQ